MILDLNEKNTILYCFEDIIFSTKKSIYRNYYFFAFTSKIFTAESYQLLLKHDLFKTSGKYWLKQFKENNFDVNDKKWMTTERNWQL